MIETPSGATGSSTVERSIRCAPESCHSKTARPPRRPPEMGKLNQVADGVWVRQSEWVWTNSIAVRGEDGLTLIDPGIEGSELNELAYDVDRLGLPVVAGFSTIPLLP